MSRQIEQGADTCVRCGAAFTCRPTDVEHCDCTAVALTLAETRFIAAQFDACLCNACLHQLKEQYASSQKPGALFCWSGGKDSAMALHRVIVENQYEVKYLLTTVNQSYKRISMHGVREILLEAQAEAMGFPLLKVEVSEGSNAEYERQMAATLHKAKAEHITHVIFGDIFLEDLRAYRESNLASLGMTAVFPLWKESTTGLIHHFIALKFRTLLCCTNDAFLDDSWLGREIDETFLDALPPNVDPCGENGEYHTFCFDGPIFRRPIAVKPGETVYKPLDPAPAISAEVPVTKGFWFIDLLPA